MALMKEMLREKMKDPRVVVLNVLPTAEFEKLHITGSKSLPLAGDLVGFVEAVEKKFGRDHFFVTHCSGYGCSAGPNAARALKEKGFEAEYYGGGIEEWSAAGYPTEGTVARAPETGKTTATGRTR